jgi:hypothetical protein
MSKMPLALYNRVISKSVLGEKLSVIRSLHGLVDLTTLRYFSSTSRYLSPYNREPGSQKFYTGRR